jgi:hypothetical protein
MALGQRAGLEVLTGEHVRVGRRWGVNSQVKVPCLMAGTIGRRTASMTRVCVGAGPALFGGVRTPSALASFLRTFTALVARFRWPEALRREPASAVSVIAGAARVGKAALSWHWAHRFPDGSSINLPGEYDPSDRLRSPLHFGPPLASAPATSSSCTRNRGLRWTRSGASLPQLAR